jgi:hypothetical protein
MISTVVELISGTRPHIEGGAVQNRCAAACRGEAAIASHCIDFLVREGNEAYERLTATTE